MDVPSYLTEDYKPEIRICPKIFEKQRKSGDSNGCLLRMGKTGTATNFSFRRNQSQSLFSLKKKMVAPV